MERLINTKPDIHPRKYLESINVLEGNQLIEVANRIKYYTVLYKVLYCII